MPSALSLPKISTNVRFAASALLFPEIASAWAERLFLTPPRPGSPASALDLIDAKSGMLEHRGRSIATWTWGAKSRESPAVLLAHGWGGHAAQMRGFVFPLLSAGYRVIAYDQPAHGVSEGKLTGLPDFAEVLAELAARHEVRAVIGHSLGASAAALALALGRTRVETTVLVSPPSDLVGYSQRFARWYWMPERVRRAMQAAIEDRYGVQWESLEIGSLASALSARALVIHDWNDRAVPWSQGAEVARRWPGAQLLTTRNLGHRRILEDEAVVRAAADFVAKRESAPLPAPLY